jgi:DNA topoisomerase-3
VIVVLAEKPAVAKDIAAVLGASQRCAGYWQGKDYCVTYAVGHLVRVANPEEIDEAWKGFWRVEQLPMLPAHFPLVVEERTKDQFAVVKKLLCARTTTEIVNATDAGREGELIFRFIYEAAGARAPVKRLWISSLTHKAIGDGMKCLKPSSAYDALASSARARRLADWLVGMNLTVAYTLQTGRFVSVGRVQTPTLQMVVERDAEIAGHKPEAFRNVRAWFGSAEHGSFEALYTRRVEDPATGAPKDSVRLPPVGVGLSPTEDADLVAARARAGVARIGHVERRSEAKPPPRLFDLTQLQREANRLWGWTASETLATAQRLYEEHKVLSYPRTDSNFLSTDVAATLPRIVERVSAPFAGLLAPDTGQRALGKRFVEDSQVRDHHAIIPTGTEPRQLAPGSKEAQLYDLVVRRLLQAWQPDLIEALTVVDVLVTHGVGRDRYVARGRTVVQAGWSALAPEQRTASKSEALLPPGLVAGLALTVEKVEVRDDKTRPKSPLTEAELLKCMEAAGRSLPDELAAAMKDRGLGTPATRAAIIETLVARGYVVREGKSLRSTDAGQALVKTVHPHVCDPAMTGEWERRLSLIARGEASSADFLHEVSKFVVTTQADALKNGAAPRQATRRGDASASTGGAGSARKKRSAPRSRARKGAVGA